VARDEERIERNVVGCERRRHARAQRLRLRGGIPRVEEHLAERLSEVDAIMTCASLSEIATALAKVMRDAAAIVTVMVVVVVVVESARSH